MKTNNVQRSSIREIHSMHELQMEKARLKLELMKSEEKIRTNYRMILRAFSLRNIFSTMTELTSTSSMVSKAFTIGKNWIANRKKKKKAKAAKVEAVKSAGEEIK